jgi:hypothetical protein
MLASSVAPFTMDYVKLDDTATVQAADRIGKFLLIVLGARRIIMVNVIRVCLT